MKHFTIGLLVIMLALAGGVQFYDSHLAQLFFVALFVSMLAMALSMKSRPPLIGPALTVYLAVIISGLANLHLGHPLLVRWFITALGLVAMVWAADYEPEDVRRGLLWAGLLWPLAVTVAWATELWINANVITFWSGLFLVVAIFSDRRFPLVTNRILNALILLVMQGRGAILGTAAAISWPYLTDRRAATVAGVGLAGLVIWLWTWSPGTALNRLTYWEAAWQGWLSAPLFGLGPGGLWAGQVIPEPGGGHQIHAHNFLMTWLAECGLVGLAALLLAGKQVYDLRPRLRVEPWQVAALVMAAVHSMVDEPLYWPGPLVVMAIIIGSIKWTERSAAATVP